MKIYHLTSAAWNGYIELVFNDNQLLDGWSNQAELSQDQHRYLIKNLPGDISELSKLQTPHTTITEVPWEVSFDSFWNKYDDKVISSKHKCKMIWSRLTPVDRMKSYSYIQKYFNAIPMGTRKKNAETYLRSFLWNN
jgi:hypothetical protein